MIGDKTIFDIRRAGRALVRDVIDVYTDIKPSRDWHRYGEVAEVGIEPGDYLDLLDLRFAIGLRVNVHGTDAERVVEVAAAFAKAKAKRVIATVFEHVNHRVRIISTTDTEGVLTWPR